MLNPSIFLIVFLGYFAGLVCYFINFETQKEGLLVWGRQFVFMALVLHSIFLMALYSQTRSVATPYFSEYLAAFLVLTVSYVMEWKYKARFLLLFSLPVALLLCFLALLTGPGNFSGVFTGSGWLVVHLTFILSGVAGLVTAFSSAIMYLLQSTQLKSKHLGKVFLKLPSLEALDRIHFHALSFGVILFSLGILTGIFWAKDLQELGQVWRDPKVIWSFVTCAMYWAILGFRMSALRRGQKIAIGTLLVFGMLAATFFSAHAIPSALTRGF